MQSGSIQKFIEFDILPYPHSGFSHFAAINSKAVDSAKNFIDFKQQKENIFVFIITILDYLIKIIIIFNLIHKIMKLNLLISIKTQIHTKRIINYKVNFLNCFHYQTNNCIHVWRGMNFSDLNKHIFYFIKYFDVAQYLADILKYCEQGASREQLKLETMGKKQKKESTYTTAQTYKIHKNKSLKANLSEYIKVLKARHSNISTKEYINSIHKYISQYLKKKGPLPQSLVVQTTSKIKICKGCDRWAMGSKKMVGCGACQDYYHIQCAKDYNPKQTWGCQSCLRITPKKDLQKKIKKQSQRPQCEKCDKNKNQVFLKCLKCSNFYHKSCYGKSNVVCGTCNQNITAKIVKYKQLSLKQSFKRAENSSYKKKSRESQQLERTSEKVQQSKIEVKSWSQPLNNADVSFKKFKQQICQSTTASTVFSNSKRFVASFPEMTEQQIAKYKENLLFAILSKNMEYQQNLVCHDCQLFDDNEDSLDFALTHLSFSDMRKLHEYKKQPIGPFRLEYREQCGYDVVADKDLPKGMIVCEYVGDVYTHRQALRLQQNDSIMQLKIGKNADQSLFIVPRHYTNIARFINGVNEEDKDRQKKQNVTTVRALAQGRPIVVLYTSRAIKKDESLLYNYNAGGASVKYDTTYYV